MYGQDWNQYFYELQQHIQNLESRMKTLEDQVRQLKSNQNQDPMDRVNIEKVEYKFDQLKIETLSGSLHIGLSPENLEQIEDFALGQTNSTAQGLPSFNQKLCTDLNNWLQQSGPSMIDSLANTHERTIDSSHQSLLLQDIQKQLPNRISYYKEQAEKNNATSNDQEFENFIKTKVKEEIQHSLATYMKKHKGE
ncbi:spore germination protein GerPC [Oceanobacillus sp. Castelsardo]|uniref:spore germination protein GerPC n=1 Tax=Oceanobacillus sp. Castelsardo TaxID=1851204 RepID=UPI0008395EA5|nr:spore germination protein GerPC [Oceanobacillus sp. Castelsardo]